MLIVIIIVFLILYFFFYDLIFQDSLDKLKQKEKTFLYWVSHCIYLLAGVVTIMNFYHNKDDYSPSEFAFYLEPILSYILYTIPAVIIFEIYIWIQKKRENDRSMRKSNNQKNITSDTSPPIYYIAYFVTVIAVILFVYFEYNLLNDPIGKTDKFGTHVINFFVCFTLPIILWIANALISTNEVDNELSKVYKQPIKNNKSEVRSEARKRLREAKSDYEEGFITLAEYHKILNENKPKIL